MTEALAQRFPRGFLWGAATSAFQIEGSTSADGRGESIWDEFCRVPGAVAGGDTGDPACDHYRRYRKDVDLMARLGLGAYRFSIAWPRVLPEGTGRVEQAGLDFYDRLVDALLERGIQPFVTLYHWDLPQALQERGGWASPDAVGWFGEYAAVVAERLGDRVHDWITLNEPAVQAFVGHLDGRHAPGIRDLATALQVADHQLLAHEAGAAAVRAAVRAAQVGIALSIVHVEPATRDPEDEAAARRVDGGEHRWFLEPLVGRPYPEDLAAWYDARVPDLALAAGRGLNEPLDFLGVNYYTRHLVRASAEGRLGAEREEAPGLERTALGWEVFPDGLRAQLWRLRRDYGPLRLLVTENGAAYDEPVKDEQRRRYLESHLGAVADALADGVLVEGYFAWSLLDNFEWAQGYSARFGLVHVDYETQRRTVRESGRWYAALVKAWRRLHAA